MDGQHHRWQLALHFQDATAALGRLIRDKGSAEAVSLSTPRLRDYLPPRYHQRQARYQPPDADSFFRAGWQLVAIGDTAYPALLAQISDPPGILFVRGDIASLGTPQIAIVGARGASPEGRQQASRFAAGLAKAGFAVTSGLAQGIDAAAHEGALGAGRTLAVMATGPERIYPAAHTKLAKRILQAGGTLVTEFPPGIRTRRDHFTQRNRIITGMSLGTVVVEARIQSGSLVSARLAAEQGREVFAVPGSLQNPFSRGCHRLLRDGANWLETLEDIREVFPSMCHLAETAAPQSPATSISHPLLEHFITGLNPAEALAERSGLPVDQLLAQLTELEIEGLVQRLPGGYTRSGI